jgi:hypothetical protein
MLQRVFRWFSHLPRCLWVFDRFSFRLHSRDSIECRDVLGPPLVFLAYLSLSSPDISCASFSTHSTPVSGSPGPTAAAAETASPLTVPFVRWRGG